MARVAGVSTALVHYHFDTKQRLVAAAASRLADARAERRAVALAAGPGLEALDELWRSLADSVASGDEGAWGELLALARGDRGLHAVLRNARAVEQRSLASRLPGLLAELGAEPATDETVLAGVVTATLEGLVQALLAGESPEDVRNAYDAWWLVLISARPRGAPQ